MIPSSAPVGISGCPVPGDRPARIGTHPNARASGARAASRTPVAAKVTAATEEMNPRRPVAASSPPGTDAASALELTWLARVQRSRARRRTTAGRAGTTAKAAAVDIAMRRAARRRSAGRARWCDRGRGVVAWPGGSKPSLLFRLGARQDTFSGGYGPVPPPRRPLRHARVARVRPRVGARRRARSEVRLAPRALPSRPSTPRVRPRLRSPPLPHPRSRPQSLERWRLRAPRPSQHPSRGGSRRGVADDARFRARRRRAPRPGYDPPTLTDSRSPRWLA